MAFKVAMQKLNNYADSLRGQEPYTCPCDTLQQAPKSAFGEEVEQMRKHGKVIVGSVSSLTVRQMEEACGSLHVLARKIDERARELNYARSRVPEMEKNCVLLSQPDVDQTQNPIGWIEQVLDRSLPKLSCVGFFPKYVGKLDLSDAVIVMQKELALIDLEKCKKIASDYERSSKAILGLVQDLNRAIDEVQR